MMLSIFRASVLMFAVGLAGAAMAATMPEWEAALKRQLAAEEKCELNYLTAVKVTELAGRPSIEARAHCIDGRAFDVNTFGAGDRFEIRECGIVAC